MSFLINLPEIHRPLCPRHNTRLVTKIQWLLENVIQHNGKSDEDENISAARKRNEELKAANLTDK